MSERPSSRKKRRKWARKLIILMSLSFAAVLLIDMAVENYAKGRSFNSTDDIPRNKVGLVLGTSKYSKQGTNLFYAGRIDAAVQLFKAGKVDYLLISGDNATKYYNEPKTFREDLINRGIPKERIVLDYAGFRTLDSMVRAKEVFGQEKITVISQQFHNERAIYIGSKKGMEVIGYNARDVGGDYGLKVKLRERLARVQMMLDLLFGKNPKFLGQQITIG